jgi:hypothetical protein
MPGGGGGRECMHNLGEKPGRRGPLGRPRCRWEGNVIMGLKDIDRRGMD